MKLIFAILAIGGYILNIRGNYKLSYTLWLMSNTSWAIYSIYKQEFTLAIMFFTYDAFCIYGIIKVTKNQGRQ